MSTGNTYWTILSSSCLLAVVAMSPVSGANKGDATKGKEVFSKSSCAVCHADGGNKFDPSKPIKGAAFEKKYPKDADIEKVIRSGVKGTAMQSYGKEKISNGDMKDLIAYMRSLK